MNKSQEITRAAEVREASLGNRFRHFLGNADLAAACLALPPPILCSSQLHSHARSLPGETFSAWKEGALSGPAGREGEEGWEWVSESLRQEPCFGSAWRVEVTGAWEPGPAGQH